MVSATDIVRHIRKLLIQPENWIQNGYCRDNAGNKVSPEAACKFCLVGALHRTKHDLGIDIFSFAYQRAFLALNTASNGLIQFNDNPDTVHQAVLEMLDRAEKALP